MLLPTPMNDSASHSEHCINATVHRRIIVTWWDNTKNNNINIWYQSKNAINKKNNGYQECNDFTHLIVFYICKGYIYITEKNKNYVKFTSSISSFCSNTLAVNIFGGGPLSLLFWSMRKMSSASKVT